MDSTDDFIKELKEQKVQVPFICVVIFGIAGIIELFYILNLFIDSTNSVYISIIILTIQAALLYKVITIHIKDVTIPISFIFYPPIGVIGFISLVYEKIGFVSIPLLSFLLMLSYIRLLGLIKTSKSQNELRERPFLGFFAVIGVITTVIIVGKIILFMYLLFNKDVPFDIFNFSYMLKFFADGNFIPSYYHNFSTYDIRKNIESIPTFILVYLGTLYSLIMELFEYSPINKVFYISSLIFSFFGAIGIFLFISILGINTYLLVLTIAPVYIYSLFFEKSSSRTLNTDFRTPLNRHNSL